MEAAKVSATHGVARSLPAKFEALVANPRLQLSKVEKKKIHLLQEQLQNLIDANYLLDPSEVEFPASAARCWVEEVREFSYDIDDFHDELVHKYHAMKNSHRSRWITSEISRFRTRLDKTIDRYKTYIETNQKRMKPQQNKCPLPPLYEIEAACPVGIDDSLGSCTEWLNENEEPKLRVVAVVGLGGVGKTTLAKQLYQKLGNQFQCRAFVRSSQMPDVSKLLNSILLQVRPHKAPDVTESSDLGNTIKRYLRNKKYDFLSHKFLNHSGMFCPAFLSVTSIYV